MTFQSAKIVFPHDVRSRVSSLLSWLFFFSSLFLTHRLINWKPRRFATRWTLCGTRRSLTVESQRKTCTAKHSGKCLGASVLFVSFLSEKRRLLAKDLISSRPLAGCLVHDLQSSPHVFFTWLSLFSPSTEPLSPAVLVAPHLSCPDNIPALKFKPPLPLCLAFHPLLLPPFKLQWQIEVSLNTAGSFNFIDLTLWRWRKLRIVSGCELNLGPCCSRWSAIYIGTRLDLLGDKSERTGSPCTSPPTLLAQEMCINYQEGGGLTYWNHPRCWNGLI